MTIRSEYSIGPLTAAVTETADPIFAVIEVHRGASKAWSARKAEIEQLLELADKTAGPAEIEIPRDGRMVRAACYSDIAKIVAEDEVALVHYSTLLHRRLEARLAVTGDVDQIGERESEAEYMALKQFEKTVPTTLSGLLAKIEYAATLQQRDGGFDLFDVNVLLGSLAQSAGLVSPRRKLNS